MAVGQERKKRSKAVTTRGMTRAVLIVLTLFWMMLLVPSLMAAMGSDNVMLIPGIGIPVGPLLTRALSALPLILAVTIVLAWVLYANEAYRDSVAVAVVLPVLNLAIIAALWHLR